jgi:hypothetical protein
MPHPDAPMVYCGSREQIDRLRALFEEHMPTPPTLEERAARCREMGLVLCTCTGIDRNDEPRLLIYDPKCEVHGKVA